MAQKVEPMDITEPVQVFVRPKFDRPSLLPPSSHVRDGYTIQPVEARHSALVYIRHRVFGVYKRLFSIVALGNLAALIYVACQYTNPTLSNAALLSTAISANLFVACLFRTEDFINLLYSSVVWVPLTLSLSIRRRLANIYEFGGIHSGTGVACTSWTLLFCIQITRAHLAGEPVGPGVLTVTFLILSLLLFMVAGAQPAFRSAQHNIFEATHRICGCKGPSSFVLDARVVLTKAYFRGLPDPLLAFNDPPRLSDRNFRLPDLHHSTFYDPNILPLNRHHCPHHPPLAPPAAYNSSSNDSILTRHAPSLPWVHDRETDADCPYQHLSTLRMARLRHYTTHGP